MEDEILDWNLNDDPYHLVGATVRARTGRNRVSVGFSLPVGRRPAIVPRGTIGEFSSRSKGRMCEYLVNCYAAYRYLGTLTIADDILSFEQFKSALDRYLVWFLRAQRQGARRRGEDDAGSSIMWFLEFQARGAPHIHLLYTNYVHWSEAAANWCQFIDQPWAFQSSTKFEEIRSGRQGSIGYVMKYAAKSEQKALPSDVEGYGRFWGVRGMRTTMSADIALTVTPENCEAVQQLLQRIKVLAIDGVDQGDSNAVLWKYKTGLVIWQKKKPWDAFLAESGWRASIEIQLAKLCTLPGASLTRDPVEVAE